MDFSVESEGYETVVCGESVDGMVSLSAMFGYSGSASCPVVLYPCPA